ncbi:YhgE/Pip domain-containing protein [Texcoconibacillus texcoconensis]|uniref:Putative membrane protein n=1 Tax=Texcoconibacillus texcoconensis TaxID=1095777 RepID=A0A840QTV4_9BACI|nr:YhgE/Pip domain-containing protein [Texcoconibacillus texcoconensis]MBB5174729.1 putative membrane protein [Texcoconibacillus texcoconensis]
MSNIWRIFQQDLQNIKRVPLVGVLLIGLAILPALYAWFNLSASWDPYSNTEGVRVAIANEDAGAELNGNTLNVGGELEDNLKNDDNLGWQFVSKEEAERGVEYGDYYASIYIGESFSEDITSVVSGSPITAEVQYEVNEKINSIAPKMTESGASAITDQINQQFVEAASSAMFQEFDRLGIRLEEELPTFRRTKEIVYELEDRFPQIRDFGDIIIEIDDSWEEIEENAEHIIALEEMIPDIYEGTSRILALEERMPEIVAATERILDLEEASPEIEQAVEEMIEMSERFPELTEVVEESQEGTQTAILKIEEAKSLIPDAENRVQVVEEYIADLRTFLDETEEGIEPLLSSLAWNVQFAEETISTIDDALAELEDEENLLQAADRLQRLNEDISTAIALLSLSQDVFQQLDEHDVDETVTDLDEQLSESIVSIQELQNDLTELGDELQNGKIPEEMDELQDQLQQVSNEIDQIYTFLQENEEVILIYLANLEGESETISSYIEELEESLIEAEENMNDDLNEQVEQLNDTLNQIDQELSDLYESVENEEQWKGYVQSLEEHGDTLESDIAAVDDVIDQYRRLYELTEDEQISDLIDMWEGEGTPEAAALENVELEDGLETEEVIEEASDTGEVIENGDAVEEEDAEETAENEDGREGDSEETVKNDEDQEDTGSDEPVENGDAEEENEYDPNSDKAVKDTLLQLQQDIDELVSKEEQDSEEIKGVQKNQSEAKEAVAEFSKESGNIDGALEGTEDVLGILLHILIDSLGSVHQAIAELDELLQDEETWEHAGERLQDVSQQLDGPLSMLEDTQALFDVLDEVTEDINLAEIDEQIADTLSTLETLETSIDELTEDLESGEVPGSEQINSFRNDLETAGQQAQQLYGFLEYEAEELIDEVFLEIRDGLDLADDTLEEAHEYVDVLEEVLIYAEDIASTADETLDDLAQQMPEWEEQVEEVAENIEQELPVVLNALEQMGDFIRGDFSNLEEMVYQMADVIRDDLPAVEEEYRKIANFLEENLSDIEHAFADLSDIAKQKLPNLEENISTAADQIREIEEDDQMNELISLLRNDLDEESDFFAQPVQLDETKLFPIPNYGSANAPFYTTLSLWVGALLLCNLISTKLQGDDAREGYSLRDIYFGRMILFLIVAILQGLVVSIGNLTLLGAYTAHPILFILFSVVIGVIFMTMVYTLTSILGNIGKALAIVMLVLQLSGGGGMFPIEVAPEFFQNMHPYLPFTYAIDLFREAVGGVIPSLAWKSLLMLLVFWVIFILIGFILKPILAARIEETYQKSKSSRLVE